MPAGCSTTNAYRGDPSSFFPRVRELLSPLTHIASLSRAPPLPSVQAKKAAPKKAAPKKVAPKKAPKKGTRTLANARFTFHTHFKPRIELPLKFVKTFSPHCELSFWVLHSRSRPSFLLLPAVSHGYLHFTRANVRPPSASF